MIFAKNSYSRLFFQNFPTEILISSKNMFIKDHTILQDRCLRWGIFLKLGKLGGCVLCTWCIYRFVTSQPGIIRKLDALSPETAPHGFYVGFKYADPLYTTALQQMETDGVERAVLFPQFPQYSCPTTGSNINNVFRYFSKR